MALPPPMLDLTIAMHECPYCHTMFAPIDMILHLRDNHPLTLSLWIASSISTSGIADTVAMLLNGSVYDEDTDTEPELSYEYWLHIEEHIGNHEVGVADINQCAPLIVDADKESQCPICFDDLNNHHHIRKITKCNHEYCAPCIEKWLSFKKVCPICRADVE